MLTSDAGDDRRRGCRSAFEDQLASAKKCGHMGGKVLIPVMEFIKKLIAAGSLLMSPASPPF